LGLNSGLRFSPGQKHRGKYRRRRVSFAWAGNGKTSEFVYGPDGERLRKRANTGPGGSIRASAYVGPEYELSYNVQANADVWTKYPHPDFKRVGSGPTAKTFFHHRDHLKSVRLITDDTGASVKRTTYFAYGDRGIESGAATHSEEKGYIGESHDAETGLLYLHARYYDPELGRFIQPDTIIPDLSNPQSFNRYTYVLNNPLKYTDPSGHQNEAATAPKVSFWDKAKMHLMMLDPKNQGQPMMISGPAFEKAQQEQKKAAEAIQAAKQQIIQAEKMTPEGIVKDALKKELARGQNKDVITTEPPSGLEKAAEKITEQAIDTAVDEAAKKADEAPKTGPTEPYNRQKHYGKTPTAADRKAVGAGAGEVADHQPSLVERYYEGDASIGEPPGYTMTPEQRKESAGDRNRMAPQPRAESNAQGAEKARYSIEQKKKHGL